ncbi:hypothetical protein [Delftia acidovorans]|jgi:hypothetical protein|uniref:hypothetical protein n=1 Tax=Delftia acidovorans TaxID=80866 RepID=UPI00333F6D03
MHWDAKKRKAQTNARRSASGRSSNEGHHAGALPQDAAAMENYMTLSEISGVSPIYKLQKTK